MSKCPRCHCEATGQNRLVTDSCGHNKCRVCLLADVSDCLECKVASRIPIDDYPRQPEAELQLTQNTTGTHIKITAQGYHCNVCNKSFRSRTQQYYHRTCGNETLKKFCCPQCNRRFASRSHLKYHLNSHDNNTKYICNVCGKVFKQQLVLQRHMYIHKPDTFACQQCQRLFRTQTALTTHLLVHSGDSLSYKCDTCSKHYLTKANLKQHRLNHDQNSTRYSCPVCNKTFLRQSTLRLHQKRHNKLARLSCPKCNKTFNDVDALSRHTKQHSATQSYRCTQCDVIINRRDNMIRHLRSMHPGVQFDSGIQIIDAESFNQANADPTETSQIQRQRFNSVIKSVGNVEPVKFAIPQPKFELETTTGVAPSQCDKMQNENVKLYRKIILDLDNEEYSNELSNGLDMDHPVTAIDVDRETLQQCHTQPQHQRVPGHGSLNFSERHWRKNFKYSYENEHTN